MPGNVENTDLHCEQLRQLAEQRHAASMSCHRLASAARTIEDRIVYEEMARRIAEEAAALKRRLQTWKVPESQTNGASREQDG